MGGDLAPSRACRSLRRAVLVPALLALAAGPAAAATIYVAFGDSITAGVGDSTPQPSGYPMRLQTLLRNAGSDATVVNAGQGGEDTTQGITRIDSVLAANPGASVLLLMEGTNDISRGISIETTRFNLSQMAEKAAARGMDTVHATMIPRYPAAKVDAANVTNQQLVQRVRDLAGANHRELVDNFYVFGIQANLFQHFYSTIQPDPVGHPNAAGYDLMAGTFFDVLSGADNVPPVPGLTVPEPFAQEVSADTRIAVDVWDFGAGVDIGNTSLLVNGLPVATAALGDGSRGVLSYQPPQPLSGTVHVGLRTQDLANPPNTFDNDIFTFTVAGAQGIPGDIDGSGRVDGADLVLLAVHFGARQGELDYLAAADLNADGVIDGLDLAILASNFGQGN